MPGRMAVRSGRSAGPRPFSSEWLAADAPIEPPRAAYRLPAWIPNGRTVSTVILIVVSIAAASAALLGGNRAMFTAPAPTQTLILPAPAPGASGAPTVAPNLSVPVPTAPAIVASEASETGSGAQPVPEF